MPLNRLKPAVPKHWLMAVAGCVWLTVGGMLLGMAWIRMQDHTIPQTAGLLVAGLLLALLLHHFLLTRLVWRNVSRIERYTEKGCLFAFQAWRSYLVVLVMIGMGSLLRHAPLPREILAVVYTAMGGALGLSSLTYFTCWRQRRKER